MEIDNSCNNHFNTNNTHNLECDRSAKTAVPNNEYPVYNLRLLPFRGETHKNSRKRESEKGENRTHLKQEKKMSGEKRQKKREKKKRESTVVYLDEAKKTEKNSS